MDQCSVKIDADKIQGETLRDLSFKIKRKRIPVKQRADALPVARLVGLSS